MLERLNKLFGWSVSPVHVQHINTASGAVDVASGKALQALVDTTIIAVVGSNAVGGDITLAGLVIPAGMTVYIRHNNIQVTGEVISYGG